MAALSPDTLDDRAGPAPVVPRPPDALPAGTLLDGGRFRLGAPLGRGGFGITYAAEDLRLRRPVAIKELFPDGARREGPSVVVPGSAAEGFARARRRFLREATTLARFGHPSIVRIFAAFEENATAYLVLERLDGRTLGQELRARRGPFSEAEALEVAGQVAAALAVVHRAGVLHRDVSPGNLVRTGDGRVVLIDFGLARPFADDHTTTMTRIVTPGYAPPEQYAGQARFSTRADVYALGATLHRLLSGSVPPDPAARARGREPDPLWRVNPTVSRRVSDAVGAALALEAGDRPPSVAALLDRLGVPTDDLDLPDPDDGPEDGDDVATEVVSAGVALAAVAGARDAAAPVPPVDPDGPTEHVRAAAPPPAAPAAEPDGATEHVDPQAPWAASPQVAPGWRPSAPPQPADAPGVREAPRPGVRPASHVVPAPGSRSPAPAPAERAAPPGPAGHGRPQPAPPGTPGAPPAGRSWVTVPLGLAAVALTSAQPITLTVLLALGAAPLLATVGDRVVRPHRPPGWMAAWWLRNLAIGAVRSLGALVALGLGLGLWYGTEAFDALTAAGPWVLRATGVAAGGILCLSIGRGSPGFRSHIALDALTRRLMPGGSLTVAVGVLVVICVGVVAGGLWFEPEAWPLGR